MLSSLLLAVSAAALANGRVMRRDGCQTIPSTGKADNTFNNGAPQLAAMPPDPEGNPPACYGARDIDIPFGRLYHGNGKFFPAGQLNTPNEKQDKWYPQGSDSASQSACGIPDNAWSISKVAIHPYFLKYADLSRFCEQDVCISFWNEDGSSDMMLKVTDICSTDPNDPTHCETPADIKIDRTKMAIMQHLTDKPVADYPQLSGSQYPEKIWWFFTKCWGDGSPQPAYKGNNWFTTPELPSNLHWSQDTQHTQWENNQKSYPSKGWPTYPNGAYNTKRDDTTSPPISDWAPGDATPAWQPIAGGKGWGVPNSNGPAPGSVSAASTTNSTQGSGQGEGQGAGQGGGQGEGQGAGQGGGQGEGQGAGQGSGQGGGQGSGQGGNPSTTTSPGINSTLSTLSSPKSAKQPEGAASLTAPKLAGQSVPNSAEGETQDECDAEEE